MAERRTKVMTTSSPVRSSSSTVTSNSPQSANNRSVTQSQQSHTFTTIKETTRTTKHDGKGDSRTTSKTRTVYHVDGKPVELNWFDRLRLAVMGRYEKQAFLAEKLLEQERKEKNKLGGGNKKKRQNKTKTTTTTISRS